MSVLTMSEFNKHLKNKDFSGVYFLYGEEKYIIHNSTKKLIDAVTENSDSDFDFCVFDLSKASINDVSDFLFTFPIMSRYKCGLINDIEIQSLKKDELNELKELIKNIPENSVLIISMKTIDLDEKKAAIKNFIKLIDKNGLVFKSDFLSENKLKNEIIAYAKKKDCGISVSAALKLVRNSPPGLTGIFNELSKLCALKNGREILESDIEKLVSKNLQTTVFILSKAILNNQLEKSLFLLNILISNRENPIVILSVISSNYIDVFRAKMSLKNNIDFSDIINYFADDYKGREFKFRNAMSLCSKFSFQQIKKSLNILLETDLKLKQTQLDKKIVMQKLFVELSLIYGGEVVNC